MVSINIPAMGQKLLILVRHGQYFPAKEKSLERLTPKGRKQAKYAARRLKEYKIDRIVHSTMPRAVETASIVKRELRYRGRFESCDTLREGIPVMTQSLRKKLKDFKPKEVTAHRKQIDRALKKYFKAERGRRDRIEVLVCHGNVIRYLLCRLLDIDGKKWTQMDITQCGISVVRIDTKGTHRIKLISHNEVGHIPAGLRTFL